MIGTKIFTSKELEDGFKIEDKPKYDFVIDDATSLLLKSDLKDKIIVYIDLYDFNEDSFDSIKAITDNFKNEVIIVRCSVFTKEFPEQDYYLDDPTTLDEDKIGKKPLPIDEILERDSSKFRELGFIDINEYCGLEFSIPMVYNNKSGKIIANTSKKLD